MISTSLRSDSNPNPSWLDQIRHHHVAFLGGHFAARFLDQILSLGRKADEQAVALAFSDLGQNVGSWIKRQRKPRRRFFQLLAGDFRNIIIGDGSALDNDGRSWQDFP